MEFQGGVSFELVPDGHTVNTDPYAQQLRRVYDAWKACYPALVNRRRTFLEHDNIPVHTADVTKCKLEGLGVLSQSPYCSDLPL